MPQRAYARGVLPRDFHYVVEPRDLFLCAGATCESRVIQTVRVTGPCIHFCLIVNTIVFPIIMSDYQTSEDDQAEFEEFMFIPDANIDDNVEEKSDDEMADEEDNCEVQDGFYQAVYDSYDSHQKLLEPNQTYEYVDGECVSEPFSTEEKLFLTSEQKQSISELSKIDLFELFFSQEVKNYIIEATAENNYELGMERLETFVGILIFSIVNGRKHEREFWSTDEFFRSECVASAMSRNEYLDIKRHIKYSKQKDKNLNDRAWRVRAIIEIFKKNLQQFGFFSSSLSVDESMIRFFGRCIMKQYMKNKPIKFGLKLWVLATISGFMLDFDIYCGKESVSDEKLEKCTLGTKAVMQTLENFLLTVPHNKLCEYHVCFDNFFTSPDLVVHLNNLDLKSTGTVRRDRVYEMHKIDNKNKRIAVPTSLDKDSARGCFEAKHVENSKVNYVTVKDSKIVSVMSSAAGVTPLESVKRWSTKEGARKEIPFPRCFYVYNKAMGGVDLYDQHCNDLSIKIKSKKWTWTVFLRIIETSISNATVLRNLCVDKKKKVLHMILQKLFLSII